MHQDRDKQYELETWHESTHGHGEEVLAYMLGGKKVSDGEPHYERQEHGLHVQYYVFCVMIYKVIIYILNE